MTDKFYYVGVFLLYSSTNQTLSSLIRRRDELLDKIQSHHKPLEVADDVLKVCDCLRVRHACLILRAVSLSTWAIHPELDAIDVFI